MIKITDEMKNRINKAFDEKILRLGDNVERWLSDIGFRGSTHVFDDEHMAF